MGLCLFFRATTSFINRKSSYLNKQTWKLKDKPEENSCADNFANRTLTDRKIQNHPWGFLHTPKQAANSKLKCRLDARWKKRQPPPLPDPKKHHCQRGFVSR
jgi:hypothetical protein